MLKPHTHMNKHHLSLKELSNIEEMLLHIELIKQLDPWLTPELYWEYLAQMIPNNYGQIAVFEADKCIGISGYWIGTKLYSGRYIEMDNVVVDESARSKGVGKLLVDAIVQKGKEHNCKLAMLDAYVDNKDAHRFYFREGFIIKGFHFIKKL